MLASMPDGKVASKRVPRAIREQQMLDAAIAEFARLGFHDASMDDIAAGANVSKPMVYAYLGAKEDLFVACLHREATRLMQSIADVVDAELGPEEQLWKDCGHSSATSRRIGTAGPCSTGRRRGRSRRSGPGCAPGPSRWWPG